MTLASINGYYLHTSAFAQSSIKTGVFAQISLQQLDEENCYMLNGANFSYAMNGTVSAQL